MKTPRHKNPEFLRQCGILDMWHDKTIHDFVNDPLAKKQLKNYVGRYYEMLDKGIGVFLYGANGVGKTMLMNVAFMKLIEVGCKVKIITMPELITAYTNAWYDDEAREALDRVMLRTHFLGIEEIGKEYQASAHKENHLGNNVLDNILRKRLQRKMPTWFTTNVKPSETTRMYSEDVASMLREACLIIQVTGEDMRRKIQTDLTNKYL